MKAHQSLIFVLFLLLTLSNSKTCLGQDITEELEGSIVVGKDYSFVVATPKGWISDRKSGLPNGMPIIFHSQNQTSAKNSTAIIYTIVDKRQNFNIYSLIAKDKELFKKQSPDVKITKLPSIKTKAKKIVLLMEYSSEKQNYTERVGYIADSVNFYTFVLHSTNKKEYTAAIEVFNKILDSFVIIPKEAILTKTKK